MNRPTRNRRELCVGGSGVQPAERRLPAGANPGLPAGESTFDLCGAEGKRGAGARRSVEAGGGQEVVRGEPHSDGDASAPGVELGDTSEDTRRGDGLDGQRPPPFCGPHGDSTPEQSWNQARALVSETHRRPSSRPFATHPTGIPTPRPILPVRPAIARLRHINAPTNSPDSRPGAGELVDAPGTRLPVSSTGSWWTS